MIDVIILSGPTGIGKTKISIKLAKKLNTEIISADSMQIYRNMDIGTAKIKPEEMGGIVHHLIDIKDPNDNYSVQNFQKDAFNVIDDICKKNKIPLIVGGTGLYIDSLTHKFDFLNIKPDYDMRKNLEIQYNENPDKVYSMLLKIDSNYSKYINKLEMKKMIRAIEVYNLTGKKINYDRHNKNDKYKFHLFVLNEDRDKIYEKINLRVDTMIENGLIDEVSTLLNNGLNTESQSAKAIGYKEVISYLNNEYTFEEMIEKLKQNTRRYAKRQLTWFRRNEYTTWIDKSNLNDDDIIEFIIDTLNNKI